MTPPPLPRFKVLPRGNQGPNEAPANCHYRERPTAAVLEMRNNGFELL